MAPRRSQATSKASSLSRQLRYRGLFTSQMAPTSRAYCILLSFFVGVLMMTAGSVFAHVILIRPMSGSHPMHTPPLPLACGLLLAGIVTVLGSFYVAWRYGFDDGDDSLEDDLYSFAKDDVLDQCHEHQPQQSQQRQECQLSRHQHHQHNRHQQYCQQHCEEVEDQQPSPHPCAQHQQQRQEHRPEHHQQQHQLQHQQQPQQPQQQQQQQHIQQQQQQQQQQPPQKSQQQNYYQHFQQQQHYHHHECCQTNAKIPSV